jgi:hypothetical protein
LALYHKTKIIPRKQRRNISKRYNIPGYSDKEKKAALSLNQNTTVPTKIQLDHLSDEDNESSSLYNSSSVSSFLESSKNLYG